MSEVVWVALISSGSAVAVALLTQYLSAKALQNQAATQTGRDEAQWRRTEVKELREALQQTLRQVWNQVVLTQVRLADGMNHPERYKIAAGGQVLPTAETASAAAAEALALALIGAPQIRREVESFHQATVTVEGEISDGKLHHRDASPNESLTRWQAARIELEAVISAQAQRLLQPST